MGDAPNPPPLLQERTMTRRRSTQKALFASIVGFTCSVLTGAAVAAEPAQTCEAVMAGAAQRYKIPLAVFYAVGLVETGGRNGLQPFALNIDGRASANATLSDGLRSFAAARSRGAKLIDVGCMQINFRWHGDRFASVADMFDPTRNVDYAARFLQELKVREGTWTLAVARYNAGPNNNPAQKKYVCDVMRKMVASGFGAWTVNARQFCGLDAREAAGSERQPDASSDRHS